MVKSREFHSQILKRGKKRGWHWIKGEGDGSHRIYEDKNGIRYPVPYHGAKEMGEGLRKKIIRDIISEPENLNCAWKKYVRITIRPRIT